MSDRKLQVNWPDGLKLRTQPEPTDMSYTGIKVPNGTIVDVIGEPHHYDQHFTFQLVRTPEGRKGWLTYRSGDTILLNPAKPVSFVGPSVEPEKGNRLQVNWSEGLRLRVQPEPGMASFTGVTVANGTVVTAIGEPSRHSEGYEPPYVNDEGWSQDVIVRLRTRRASMAKALKSTTTRALARIPG